MLDTFPIVREQDEARFNCYLTKELALGYMNALAAGDAAAELAIKARTSLDVIGQ